MFYHYGQPEVASGPNTHITYIHIYTHIYFCRLLLYTHVMKPPASSITTGNLKSLLAPTVTVVNGKSPNWYTYVCMYVYACMCAYMYINRHLRLPGNNDVYVCMHVSMQYLVCNYKSLLTSASLC
jgi:hypothetical protein